MGMDGKLDAERLGCVRGFRVWACARTRGGPGFGVKWGDVEPNGSRMRNL